MHATPISAVSQQANAQSMPSSLYFSTHSAGTATLEMSAMTKKEPSGAIGLRPAAVNAAQSLALLRS